MRYLFTKVSFSILSVTDSNKLVYKDIYICYNEHMPQQTGYLGSLKLFAAGKQPHSKHVKLYFTNFISGSPHIKDAIDLWS
jgi:hypothetical protein